MYETYYDMLQPFFDPILEGNLRLHYMDYESFVKSIETSNLVKKLIKLQKEKDMFDSNNFAQDHL